MHERPGPEADASEPGIFAEVVSISSTRSAGVSDSAYFIKSIGLRPTFDLFLGARRGLHFFERVSDHRAQTPAAGVRRLLPAFALIRLGSKVNVDRHAAQCGHGARRSHAEDGRKLTLPATALRDLALSARDHRRFRDNRHLEVHGDH